MASAIKRKRETIEDLVSVNQSKKSRHSRKKPRKQSTLPDANHQNGQALQTNGVKSTQVSENVSQSPTAKRISDVGLQSGHDRQSTRQNGRVEELETQSFGMEVIKATKKTSKKHRKRKHRNFTTNTGAMSVEYEEGKSFKDPAAMNILGTSPRLVSIQPSRSWTYSGPSAGRFINHKPLFVDSDRCIILAALSTLRIYSTSTSALVSSISISSNDEQPCSVIAHTTSALDDQIVYVSATNGLLFKFDWRTGQRLGEWKLSSDATALYTHSHNFHGEPEDILIYVEQFLEGSKITARSMPKGAESSEELKTVIYASILPIKNLEGDPSGMLVAHTEERLIVGSPSFKSSILDSQYIWREAQVAEKISCVDIRTHQRDKTSKKSNSAIVVDVILGDGKGAVIVYYDFLAALHMNHNSKAASTSTKTEGRQLHWHRNSIATARWSADGNYIISGGTERTLVLWQLDTGRPQYLPHLPSSIKSVMVSTAGSLYALRLGDNSVIILSTSDLEARANITGIQADTLDFTTPAVEKLGQDYSVERTLFDSHLFHRTPSVISPTRPCLLLAVPSDQDHNQKGSPYLQTFEYFSGRSISRQAIARTNATVKQIGGDLNTIYEPTVYLIKSTPDGNWLATVDLWIPPKASSCSDEKFPISSRREMYLKFWKRDQKTQEWELVTRVDAPHNAWDSDHEPGLVLDMAANPHKAEFATIGEDGTVKIWRPKVRTQNGLVIRASKMDEGLWTWSCRKFVHLNQPFDVDESNLTSSASLTYSEDASTLAACYQHGGSRDPCSVHFIQTLNGDIRFSRTGLVKGSPLAMGFLNRYLILLSEDIIVWDVVDDCLQYGFKLPSHMNNLLGPASTHLAIDYVNKSFAVALPIHMKLSTANAHQSAQIAVFSPEQPTPQFHTESPHPITALHFNPSNRGYLAIDAAAEIRHIVPKVASISEFSNALAVEPDVGESHSALRILYTELELPDQSLPHTEDGDQETLGRRNAVQDEDDDGPPIVRKEQLAEIFDVGPAFALPSVDKLFNQVAGLYIGQTKA